MKILLDGIFQAMREVRSNAFRAALTILGVALGVAALVAMLGVLESMLTGMQTFNSTRGGLTKISVNDQPVPVEQAHLKYLSEGRTLQDAEALTRNASLVRNVSPDVDLDWQPIAHGAQMDWARTHGATPALRALYDLDTKAGRFLSELDCQQAAGVCVLGSDIADQIFNPDEPVVGARVLIGGKHMFTIVGVLTHYMSRQGGRNALWRRNWTVWIPITTAQKQFTGTKKINLLEMQAVDLPSMVPAMDEVESILRPVHRWVRDFKVDNELATMQDFGRQQQRLRASLGGVAALSLLIGGIGIMSVMLAGVNDRIREIGVRRALGAQQSDIFLQFLFEATVLSSLGGIGGVVGGIGLIHFLEQVMTTQPPVLVPAALVIGAVASMITGLLAGLYPALRAASLDPIEALRAE
jgi:putative ABC transport system permease protein